MQVQRIRVGYNLQCEIQYTYLYQITNNNFIDNKLKAYNRKLLQNDLRTIYAIGKLQIVCKIYITTK